MSFHITVIQPEGSLKLEKNNIHRQRECRGCILSFCFSGYFVYKKYPIIKADKGTFEVFA